MQSIYYLTALSGLFGGFGHCIAMCGPVVATFSLSLKRLSLLPHILYNAGRITTYVFLGAAMGLAGEFFAEMVSVQIFQSIVEIIAGASMIMFGLSIASILPLFKKFERYTAVFIKLANLAAETTSIWRFFIIGIFLGLLPCGLSYSIFIASAASGSMLSGALISLLFGLSTVPALVMFGSVVGYISANLRSTLYRLSGLVIIVMGGYYIYAAVHPLLDKL